MSSPPVAPKPLRQPAVATAAWLLSLLVAAPAIAHTGSHDHGGFAVGFMHPLGGADHLFAMLAVGLWAALLGGHAVRRLVLLFPLAMALGATLAMTGVSLPGVETGIAVSAIVLGLAVASALRPAPWIAAVLVASFAVFHGQAHGAELPAGVDAFAYAAGFLLATVLLHLAGAAAGRLARRNPAAVVARFAGVAIAAAGVAFMPGL
jgi:urease accessory protein